jgi:hypothetical protein
VGVILILLLIGALSWFLLPDREHQLQRPPVVLEAAAAIDGALGVKQSPISAEPRESVGDVSAAAENWTHQYHESVDHFSLAQRLASAATRRDARAEYTLSELLLECEGHKRSLSSHPGGTLTERVESYLASESVYSTENSRQQFRREVSRCERLFSENPFEASDLPEEATDFRYWASRALESGDPLATMNRAIRSVVSRGSGPEADRAFHDSLLNDIRTAVSSGDPAALFAVGGVLSYPSVSDNPESGFAWYIAACESGHDCSNSNPDLGRGCIQAGTCEAGQTFLDVLQRDLGPAKYAEIYAKAQDIQYRIRSGDWDGLQQYLKIK